MREKSGERREEGGRRREGTIMVRIEGLENRSRALRSNPAHDASEKRTSTGAEARVCSHLFFNRKLPFIPFIH